MNTKMSPTDAGTSSIREYTPGQIIQARELPFAKILNCSNKGKEVFDYV